MQCMHGTSRAGVPAKSSMCVHVRTRSLAPGKPAARLVIPALSRRADALLRVSTATICGTDLHVLKGDVPTCAPGRILGHEGVGEARGGRCPAWGLGCGLGFLRSAAGS